MDHWRLAYLGMRQMPRELSEFELATFFTFSPKERALIDARRSHLRPCNSTKEKPASERGAGA